MDRLLRWSTTPLWGTIALSPPFPHRSVQYSGSEVVTLQLKGNTSLCLGVHGGTAINHKHGQATLLDCSPDDTTQKWSKVSGERDGRTPC